MACKKLSPQEYEKFLKWDSYKAFWCGEYFFDGEYNVVRFPKGMSLYHGSAGLVKNLIPFPLGLDYFTKPQRGAVGSDETKSTAQQIAQAMKPVISPGWYGGFQEAKIYSRQTDTLEYQCGEKCVLAYKTTRPITILLLNDPLNLEKISRKSSNTSLFNQYLTKMFTKGGTGEFLAKSTGFDDPLRSIDLNPLWRYSVREYDLPIAQEIKKILGDSYDGYGASRMKMNEKMYFHEEMIFFNPLEFLERDIKNPRDYYYFPSTPLESVNKYIISSSLFESTNVDFHAGNLIEHSVWSLLWAENACFDFFKQQIYGARIFKDEIEFRDEIKVPVSFLIKIISVMAFLHDSTKMKGYRNMLKNITRNKFIYFDDKEHPDRDPLNFPVFDKNLNVQEEISTIKVLEDMIPEYKTLSGKLKDIFGEKLLRYISRYHRDFGVQVLVKISQGQEPSRVIKDFVSSHLDEIYPKLYMTVLLLVSWADIAAAQPFSIALDDKGKRIPMIGTSYASKNFPYISNMTRVYPGGNSDLKLKIFDFSVREIFNNAIQEADDMIFNQMV